MYRFKINKIKLKNGEEFETKRINIIVGPNNSGKSRFLKDLRGFFNGIEKDNVIIESIDVDLPNDSDDFIKSYNLENRMIFTEGNYYLKNYSGIINSFINNRTFDDSVGNSNNFCFSFDWKNHIIDQIEFFNNSKLNDNDKNNYIDQYNYFMRCFGSLFYQYLGTEEKLLTCKIQYRHGIDSHYSNLLSEFSDRPDVMKELSDIIHQLFGKYIYLDQVNLSSSIGIRVSDDFDFYNNINIDDMNSKRILNNYSFLDDEGDGIKNFICSYLSVKSELKNIIMIDEPESFLHPPLALKFGEIISEKINSDQQLFIVTHSENIVKGILSKVSGNQINIIRLDRNNENNYMSMITETDITNLKRKPIILMSNILNGLFSEKVYVTESFSDSALYQSLLLKLNIDSNFYFVNTQGKDKIATVLNFYDKLGVKSIGIFDFDVFRSSNTIVKLLKCRIKDEKLYNKYTKIFSDSRNYLSELSKFHDDNIKTKTVEDNFYHKIGLKSFYKSEFYDELKCTLDDLKKYNIYVIRSGTLETVLESVEIEYSNNKDLWIDKALSKVERMKKDDVISLDIIDMFYL